VRRVLQRIAPDKAPPPPNLPIAPTTPRRPDRGEPVVSARRIGLAAGRLALLLASVSSAQQEVRRRGFSVKVTEPVNDDIVVGKTRIAATVSADDPSVVDRVEFFVNDKLVLVDREAPYEVLYDFGEQPLSWIVKAVAWHKEGLSVTSSIVTRRIVLGTTAEVNRVVLWATATDKDDRPVADLQGHRLHRPGEREAPEDPGVLGREPAHHHGHPARHLGLHAGADRGGAPGGGRVRGHAAAGRQGHGDRLQRHRVPHPGPDERPRGAEGSDHQHRAPGAHRHLRRHPRHLPEARERGGAEGDGAALGRAGHLERHQVRAGGGPVQAQQRAHLRDRPGGGFGDGPKKNVLREFAETTGGRAFFVGKASELGSVYQQIADELRRQYVLTYETDIADWNGAG
jgi:hypothetical protein